ncbi:hypothetical protein WEU32_14605 [Brevundimonas sp. BH3]|uniref:hypothetical protein n=1 Tax=Brevundimonas sp. BH3 TaxID=3133089 RepID=UPI00324FD2C5
MLVSLMTASLMLAAQDAPVTTAPPVVDAAVAIPSDIPVLEPAVASADCGGLLKAPAFCVTARMDQTGAVAEAYLAHLEQQGWLAADGDDNRVILVKRREAGGCDGLQMVAFYDTEKPQAAEAPAFLGFATIPGDVCAAPSGGTAQ